MKQGFRIGGSILMGAGLFGVGHWTTSNPLFLLAVVLFSVGLNLWHEGQP